MRRSSFPSQAFPTLLAARWNSATRRIFVLYRMGACSLPVVLLRKLGYVS